MAVTEGAGARAYVRGIIPDKENREVDDFYPTPPRATRALLSVERFNGTVLEPACGDGAISKVLQEAGHNVISNDLINRGFGTPHVDFLLDFQTRVENIITNPPFKLANEFALHAIEMASNKVAFLCRLGWLEGQERRKMFVSTPLARVWVFSGRVPMLRGGNQMMKGGGGMIAFAWYVWDKAYSGAPSLGWLP